MILKELFFLMGSAKRSLSISRTYPENKQNPCSPLTFSPLLPILQGFT